MNDCKHCELWKKHCELWKFLLVMMTVAFVVLAWAVYNADATHDPASKRLDFAPVAEYHLGKAAAGRLMRAEAKRFCPEKLLTPDCAWLVTFYAKNPDGTEEEIAYATFTTDLETTALGCMLRYMTTEQVKDPVTGKMRGKLLVDRFLAETICAERMDVN